METLGVNLTEGKALLAACRILLSPNRHAKSWSNDVPVHAAAEDTRPRTPAAPQLARYSAELRCPIRDEAAEKNASRKECGMIAGLPFHATCRIKDSMNQTVRDSKEKRQRIKQ